MLVDLPRHTGTEVKLLHQRVRDAHAVGTVIGVLLLPESIYSRPNPLSNLIRTGKVDPYGRACLAVAKREARDHGRIGTPASREVVDVVGACTYLPFWQR
jgi:hypothetical protein